ncbi:TRAP transporter large permease [Acuticoccus kandeliae]|uniref:TRAP transporter large permease n=1 Tax=Acuticoccus kandeliae TaxID=2073160 RepID=UPI000D3E1DCD|nr:TRAP transporter large permease [Acuticoccus kandeliae]
MIILFIAFAILLGIGVPIAFALGLAGAVGIIERGFTLVSVPSRMFTGIDSFILLSAPFYILAGEVMNRGGVTDRLIRFAQLLTHGLRGGTAYANTVASIVFAGISGTAIADTAALGQIFIKGMPKEGYTKEFAAAVTAAGSMIGPIIPPSVIMIIYAAASRVSVIDLFLSGVVPGLLLAASVALVIFIKGRNGGLPVSRTDVTRREVPRMAIDTLLVVSLPLFIVVGTLSGTFTATEAGGVAAVYAILLGFVVFRHLDLNGLWAALVVSARTTSSLFLIIAAATVVSYVLALSGINQFVGGLVDIFGGNTILFMLAVMGALLLVGCFLEPGAAIVLFVPLLFPVARSMGIDPLQFSMVVILTLTMGLITPPVGVCLFVACRIGDIPTMRLVKALMPFFIAELCVILLIILVPGLSSWLPGLFH